MVNGETVWTHVKHTAKTLWGAAMLIRYGVAVSVVFESAELAHYWLADVEACAVVVIRARKEALPAMDLIALMEAYDTNVDEAITKLRDMHGQPIT